MIPEIDYDALHKSVYVEAKDARYVALDNGGFKVEAETIGLDFDLEAAKALIEPGSGKTVSVDLIKTEPKVKKADLGEGKFSDLLVRRTTSLTNERDRTHNVKLAAKFMSGAVVLPGETFSFNKRVGPRTKARGFRDAKIFSDGEIVDGLGGGLCQVSSTLYSALLRTDLQIVSRRPHMFTVGYVPKGEDATIYGSSIDLKFKNNFKHPILIKSYVSGGSLTVEIYGTASDKTWGEIKVSSEVIGTTPIKEVYREDPSLKPGETKVKQKGQVGYTVNTYKTYYDANGNKVKTVSVGKSVYQSANRIILKGPGTPVEPEKPVGLF